MRQKFRKFFESFPVNKAAAACVTLMFAAYLIPLLVLSAHARPFGDDFAFGWELRTIIRGGGGLLSPIKAGINNVIRYYNGWQGSFSTVFMGSILPGVRNAKYYGFTTLIMLVSLIAPTFYLLRSRVFSLKNTEIAFVGFPLLWLGIQFPPSVREAFYWYNGAVMYTLFFGATLIWLRLLLNIINAGQPKNKTVPAFDAGPGSVAGSDSGVKNTAHKKMKPVDAVICALLGIFISGGNYVSALLTVIIAAIAFGSCILLKRARNTRIFLLILFLLMLAGLMVSALAPGNAIRAVVRQAEEPQMAFISTIIESFKQAGKDILTWTDWKIVVLAARLLVCSPGLQNGAHSASGSRCS